MYPYSGAFNKFPEFFCTGIENCRRLLKIQYVIAIHLLRWLTNCYDFRFKWTATAAIGIHLTKTWWSQLVIFKKEERYAIKFCCKLGEKGHRNVWNASDCFSTILYESKNNLLWGSSNAGALGNAEYPVIAIASSSTLAQGEVLFMGQIELFEIWTVRRQRTRWIEFIKIELFDNLTACKQMSDV